MFNLDRAISEWREQMLAEGIGTPAPLEELEGHLREEIDALMRSGISDAEAFQMARERLGEGKVLKREFAKARARTLFTHPLGVKVLAGWLIVMGLNASPTIRALLHPSVFGHGEYQIVMGVAFVLCSQVLMGIGLLRRREFWRRMARGWCATVLLLFFCSEIYVHFFWSQVLTTPMTSLLYSDIGMSAQQSLRYYFVGLPLPMIFVSIISTLNVLMLLWGWMLLKQSGVRELFERKVKSGAD